MFVTGSFPEYVFIRVCEIFGTNILVDGEEYALDILATAGQEDYDRSRPFSYPGSHVVLACFRIDEPDSLDNVIEKVCTQDSPMC